MSKPSQVILILEDEHHKRLVYTFLKWCGLGTHAIRIEISPSGEGSAESWVRRRFAKEVQAYRSRQAGTALIVVIDADTNSVFERLSQLKQALKDIGKPLTADEKEQIALLVPKRNVETWILCLNEHNVDEITDYKRTQSDWNALIPRAAEVLYQWTRANTDFPAYCVDSLRRGIDELKHLRLSAG